MQKEENSDWLLLKQIMVKWINNHQEQFIDYSLAFWLDPAGSLLRKYKVYQLEFLECTLIIIIFLVFG